MPFLCSCCMDGLVSRPFLKLTSPTSYPISPGSFYEYLPAVEGLTQRGINKQGQNGEAA
jgi:hypothetical protein